VATRGERQRATRSQEHGWEAAHGSITGMGGMSREQGGGGGGPAEEALDSFGCLGR
jgi:hypothetical protein